MKENIGFNKDLANKTEEQALKQKGLVGIDDTLEEDRYVAKVIGKNYEDIETLKDMEEIAISFQKNQEIYLDKIKYQLHELSELIRVHKKLLNTYNDKKQEKQKLHRENLRLHLESNPTEYYDQETDLEKQIVSLGEDIKILYKVIQKEKITEEGISNFHEQYERLNQKYERVSKIWNSKNATLN